MLELVSRASDGRSLAWSVLGSDGTADKLERTIACSRCRCASGYAKRPQQECAVPESAAVVLPAEELTS